MPKLLKYEYGFYMGCDPEFFLKTKDKRFIVGAEKAIPLKEGLTIKSWHNATVNSAVICDGVQAELNPSPNGCRAYVADEIKACFKHLETHLKKHTPDIVPSFVPMAKVTKKEMKSLAPQSKIFGCSPSLNTWKMPPEIPLQDIDPEKYLVRTAGGHIHIGAVHKDILSWIHNNIEIVIQMMDYVVGNTCVLLDRDPSQVERRKTYGRAGEFRKQPWGLEYRTLSNFWLRSYQLMSFVLGLSRQTALMTKQDHTAILNLVPTINIVNAINNNDFDLAMQNFKPIAKYISKIVPEDMSSFPLSSSTIPDFLFLVKKGIKVAFNKDILKHWTRLQDGHGIGFESYCRNELRQKRLGLPVLETIYN